MRSQVLSPQNELSASSANRTTFEMRLLHTTTLKLRTFDDSDSIPRYAILSHRWGDNEILYEDVLAGKAVVQPSLKPQSDEESEPYSDEEWEPYSGEAWEPYSDEESEPQSDEFLSIELSREEEFVPQLFEFFEEESESQSDKEITLVDAQPNGGCSGGKNWEKVEMCCQVARSRGFKWVWIDTCCIDQKSSAELSESINSMFGWYTMSRLCIAFLQDVPANDDPKVDGSSFRKSEWFWRGWTLQELIAPSELIFFNKDWKEIGTKKELADVVEDITNVDYGVLRGSVTLTSICVAKKMSWAANRETTKVEDRAYSLLGLFGINMTTIYGEGEKAFTRLQHEIIRQSTDHSIFAWEHIICSHDTRSLSRNTDYCGWLAPSPDYFANSSNVIAIPHSHFASQWGIENHVAELQMTNTGIRIQLPLSPLPSFPGYHAAVLSCKRLGRFLGHYTVGIIVLEDTQGQYSRLEGSGLVNVDLLVSLGAAYMAQEIYTTDNSRPMDYVRLMRHTSKELEIVVSAHTIASSTLR